MTFKTSDSGLLGKVIKFGNQILIWKNQFTSSKNVTKIKAGYRICRVLGEKYLSESD